MAFHEEEVGSSSTGLGEKEVKTFFFNEGLNRPGEGRDDRQTRLKNLGLVGKTEEWGRKNARH